MKIILILTIFITCLFGSALEINYEKLNSEIDKISTTISVEEKVSLYYLVISSHDKIVTLLSKNVKSLEDANKLKSATLDMFAKLQNKYQSKEIKELKNIYLTMNSEAVAILKKKKLEQSNLENKKKEKKHSYLNLIMSSYLVSSIFIILTLGYIIYLEKKKNLKENFPLMLELEHKNELLNKQNELLKSNARIIEENIAKNIHLKDEKNELLKKDKELNSKITKIVKDLEVAHTSHEKFISTQEKEIEDLNKYICSLKLDIKKCENDSIHTYLN